MTGGGIIKKLCLLLYRGSFCMWRWLYDRNMLHWRRLKWNRECVYMCVISLDCVPNECQWTAAMTSGSILLHHIRMEHCIIFLSFNFFQPFCSLSLDLILLLLLFWSGTSFHCHSLSPFSVNLSCLSGCRCWNDGD